MNIGNAKLWLQMSVLMVQTRSSTGRTFVDVLCYRDDNNNSNCDKECQK